MIYAHMNNKTIKKKNKPTLKGEGGLREYSRGSELA
jgi:hypothetical protein